MTPPEIRGLCPLIQVFDMPASLSFYRDLLGFEIVQQSSSGDHCDWVWLKSDDAELMLNTMFETDSRPARPDAERIMSHGDTVFYVGAPDVDAMYEYLTTCGIEAEAPVVTPYGMKQLYPHRASLVALMLVGTRFANGLCFLALPLQWSVGLHFIPVR